MSAGVDIPDEMVKKNVDRLMRQTYCASICIFLAAALLVGAWVACVTSFAR